MNDYNFLIENLKKHNYNVIEEDTSWSSNNLRVCKVTGYGIEARFCEFEPNFYMGSMNGKICADRKGSWNKAEQCDIQLEIPKTEKQFNYLFEQLKYLGSSDYKKQVQKNNYLTILEYPRKIK